MIPKLSLCMIVRNEAENLGPALDSVATAVDEIIIADTGSNDSSLEIAKQRSHRCIEIPWQEDFSQARNITLQHASGDWILILDADELLAPESRDPLRRAILKPEMLAFRLLIRNHFHGDKTNEEYMLRLFRRLPQIYFTGRIHEQVSPSIASVMAQKKHWRCANLPDVVINHLGYTQEFRTKQQKADRNIRLLRCAIADHPEDPYYYYKLSQEFGASVEGTTHLLQAAYLVLSKPVNEIKMLAYAPELLTAAALHWLQDGVINKSFYACQLALAHFPEHPATRLALGLTFLQSGDPGNARREIERALVTDPPLGGFYFDKMDWELSARTALARAMLQEGLHERAIDMLRSSRQFFPESEKVTHLLLEALLLIQKPLEALREGLRWLQHRADPQVLKYCADAAEALGDRNQAEEWRKKANGLV